MLRHIQLETVSDVSGAISHVEYPLPRTNATFNTTNENISWATWTWNPVTGCLHNCEYCYAREIALASKINFPVGFTPLFHHERLNAPKNTHLPNDASPSARRVFVCSMADLYGRWVPASWIDKVHAACIANPQWEYLFLTKFPQRYVGMKLPPTAWIGTTVDRQYRVKIAEEAFSKISGVRIKWLSCEPLLEPLAFNDLSLWDWVIIGAQTGTMQPQGYVPRFTPPLEWVTRLTEQAHKAGCKVWHKPNLPKFPGFVQEFPATLPTLGTQGSLFT
jgi:protein gp37